jgi:amino acid adenylation domain-containing protein
MWFQEQAARTPDAPAVVFDGRAYSYGDLDRRSTRLAHALSCAGLARDACVGVRLRRGIDHLVALLAVHKAGLTLVPVSSVSSVEPPERMLYILDSSRVGLLLTERGLDAVGLQVPQLFIDVADQPGHDSPPSRTSIDPDDLAYVIYTSGSTGRPKGCAMPHRGLHNLVAWQLEYSPGSSALRTLQFNALGFDLCFQEIFPTWAMGGVVVVMPEDMRREPHQLVELVSRERVARMIVPFVALRQFAEAAVQTNRALPNLREVYVGGEALQLTPAIRAMFTRNPEAALINVYGPTEAHIVTAYRVPGSPDQWPPVAPIGSPIRGARIYVVNRAGQPVPAGVPGEVLIGGDVLARGYRNNPKASADRFVPDRFSRIAGACVYRTGDLVRRLPTGALEFVGRSDHQVKIRGARVEPGEVESALATHPTIRHVVVQGRNDTGEMRLVAYIVPSGAPPSTAELRAHLTNKLPDELIPSAFVMMSELPLTGDGKVNLKALPAPNAAVPPSDVSDEHVAPRDEVEQLIAKLWQEVLGLERVGIHDNFFELGGHSFLAFRFTTRLREEISVEIRTMDIFRKPTIAELAVAVREARATTAARPPLERAAQPVPETEVSFTQRFFFRMNRELPNQIAENQLPSLRMTGPLDVGALERALNEITRRHDVLRARFRRDGDKILQCVSAWQPFQLASRAVPGDSAAERLANAAVMYKDAWLRPIDLERETTAKFELLQIAKDDHVLVAIIHHIVFDAFSYGLFYKELAALYTAFHRGEPSPLPELPLQYSDFASWQRKMVASPIGEPQLSYWRKKFGGAQLMMLRGDKPREPVEEIWARTGGGHSFPTVETSIALPDGVVAAVRRMAAELQVTTFAVLAAVKFLLVREHSGQDDVILLSSVVGRDMPGTELLLGQFNNPLPLRTTVTGGTTIRDLVMSTHRDAVDQRSHADLPATNILGEVSKVLRISFGFFIVGDARGSELPQLPELEVHPAPRSDDYDRILFHDLAFYMFDTSTAVKATVVGNAQLFSQGRLERLARDYVELANWLTGGSSDRLVDNAATRARLA